MIIDITLSLILVIALGTSHYFEVRAYKKHIEEYVRYCNILNADIYNLKMDNTRRYNRTKSQMDEMQRTINIYEEKYGELEFGGK